MIYLNWEIVNIFKTDHSIRQSDCPPLLQNAYVTDQLPHYQMLLCDGYKFKHLVPKTFPV